MKPNREHEQLLREALAELRERQTAPKQSSDSNEGNFRALNTLANIARGKRSVEKLKEKLKKKDK